MLIPDITCQSGRQGMQKVANVIYNLPPVSNSCFSHNFPVFIQKSLCQQNVCFVSPCSIVAVLHFWKCLDSSIDPKQPSVWCPHHHHERGEETLLHHKTFTFFLTRTFRPFPALWSAKCYYRKISHQRECTFLPLTSKVLLVGNNIATWADSLSWWWRCPDTTSSCSVSS